MTFDGDQYETRFRGAAHSAMFGVHLEYSVADQLVDALARQLHFAYGVGAEDAKDAIAEVLRLVEWNIFEGRFLRFYRLPDGITANSHDGERDDLNLDTGHVAAYVWTALRGRCFDARRASARWVELTESVVSNLPGPEQRLDIRLRLQEALEQAQRRRQRELAVERARYRYDEICGWIGARAQPSDRVVLDGYLEGLSEKAIAARVGQEVSTGAIRQRKLRLLGKLEARDPELAQCFRTLCDRARQRRADRLRRG